MKKLSLGLLASTLLMSNAQADHAHHHEHHHHAIDAPIGVMGAHLHETGDWMFSYRHSRMAMEQNREGTNRLSDADVLSRFMVSPTDMEMEMHMFGAMVGVSDDVTLMAMVPYTIKSMNHVTRAGGRFKTETKGFGDVKAGALVNLWQEGASSVHLNATVSLPTGSIKETDLTPLGVARLPYPMQLGSGTVDLMPSLTYLHNQANWSVGSQLATTLRLGRNSEDYSLGNEANFQLWGAYQIADNVSTSLRFDGRIWGDVDGADSNLNPNMVPTARTDLRGGKRVDALVGVDFIIPQAEGQRLAIEAGAPIYEKLDGPQLSTDWRLTAGWQGAF